MRIGADASRCPEGITLPHVEVCISTRSFAFVVSRLLVVTLGGDVRTGALQDPAGRVPGAGPRSSALPEGVVWQIAAPAPIRFIALRRPYLTVVTVGSGLHIDPADGHVAQSFQSGGDEVVTFEGLMLVADADCECQPALAAKRIPSEAVAWRSAVELPTTLSMPVIAIGDGGTGLVRGGDGRMHAVNLRNGAVRWSVGASRSIPAPWNVPVVRGARAFTVGDDRAVHALDVLSGTEHWTFRAPDGGEVSTPVPSGDAVFVSDRHHLFAIDALRGSVRWSVPLAGFVLTAPVLEGEHAYVQALVPDAGRTRERVYSIGLATQSVSQFDLPTSVPASPMIPTSWTPTLAMGDGTLYVATLDNQVVALRTGAPFVSVPSPPQPPSTAPLNAPVTSRSAAGARPAPSYEVLVNDEQRRVVSIRADGSRRRTIAETGQVLPDSCSPDGAFAALQDDRDVQLVELSTGRTRRVTVGPYAGFTWLSATQLLVYPFRGDPEPGVRPTVIAVDRVTLRTSPFAVSDDAEASPPVVSPDGTRLLFVARDASGANLYVTGVDGSNRRALTQRGDVMAAAFSWSPDGRYVAYQSDWAPVAGAASGSRDPFAEAMAAMTRQLFVTRPDGTDHRLVASKQAFYLPHEWSADGTRLLLGTGTIVAPDRCRPVLDAPDSPVLCTDTLEIEGDHVVGLRFSPDGSEILRVTSLPMGRHSLDVINLERGARALTSRNESIGSNVSICR